MVQPSMVLSINNHKFNIVQNISVNMWLQGVCRRTTFYDGDFW